MNFTQLTSAQARSKAQGDEGERFALEYEHKRLPDYLHDKIVHFGEYDVAKGYDILSCETKDSFDQDRYIEVKTFRGHPHFHWSDNQIMAARKYAEHYYLYLVDIDKINDEKYEPTIIQNPALLFNEDSQWSYQVQQYVFTLKSNEQVPDDWDDSTILLGCFNSEQHLKWILSHDLYNVRAEKDSPGAVSLINPSVSKASYLILYDIGNSSTYMMYSLNGAPNKVYKNEMIQMGYPNPHGLSYLLHPIKRQIGGFYINIRSLLKEVNHSATRPYGTPLYISGIQLRKFMLGARSQEVSISSDILSMPSPENLSEEEISQLLDKMPTFEKWIKEVKDYAVSNAKDTGIVYPGYQLKELHMRKIFDKESAISSIRQYNPSLCELCVRPQELKSLKDLEKIMGKDLFSKILNDHITINTSYRLVKENQKTLKHDIPLTLHLPHWSNDHGK